LVCIASLRPEKGVERLIRALAPLLQAHHLDLRVVGDGEERRRIERTINALSVGPAVHLLGARSDVLPTLHESDLYVSAAQVEGFGISVAEAAATGLPSVAFAVPGGLSELIVDQETGFLIPDNDFEQFRNAVVRLTNDDALRSRMGAAARDHVVKRFALPQIAAALETCFQPP
jgi:glycosyltransferase involved in cell wall biosynthesis